MEESMYYNNSYENIKIYFYCLDDETIKPFYNLIDSIFFLDNLNEILKKENKTVKWIFTGCDIDCEILNHIFKDDKDISLFFLNDENCLYMFDSTGKHIFISDLRAEF